MDLDSLIPILGIIFVIGPVSALVFSYTPLGRAIVNRLGSGAKVTDDRLLELQDELERLQEQIGYQDTPGSRSCTTEWTSPSDSSPESPRPSRSPNE